MCISPLTKSSISIPPFLTRSCSAHLLTSYWVMSYTCIAPGPFNMCIGRGHLEVSALSGRGSSVSERYLPTTNEKPSETLFQRVLLDFVLKTFGLGAENETRTRDPNLGKVVLYQLSYFRNTNILKFYDTTFRLRVQRYYKILYLQIFFEKY